MINCADCSEHKCTTACANGAKHCDGRCFKFYRRKCNKKACEEIKKENWKELKELIGRD
jgi:hypothetical protein